MFVDVIVMRVFNFCFCFDSEQGLNEFYLIQVDKSF